MHSAILMLCLFQFQSDPPRSGPTSLWDTLSPMTENDMAPSQTLQKMQKKRFEEAFNKLVFAVEAFSLAYNQNKGLTWPSDKAAALRKAMVELQKIDPNFKMPPVLDAKR